MSNVDYRKEIGRRLAQLRAAVGWSLSDVAGLMECDRSCVSRWENGRVMPAADTIAKLASMYGHSVSVVIPEYVWPEGEEE